MSSELINHSDDLRRLRDEGYHIQIRGAYLVVYEIPYVNVDRNVLRGTLISKLNLSGNTTLRPDEHQIYFAGQYPCHADGSQMTELVNQAVATKIDDSITAQFMFSRKPDSGSYVDYFEKITAYDALLSSEAEQVANVTSRVRRVEEAEDEDYPFNYLDTASARADINELSSRLALPSVAIIGLGGTGSYILDLVAKTHVKEIRLFDGDVFANHNAFRAPGAPTIDELRLQQSKAAYFAGLYSKMRRRVVAYDTFIDQRNVSLLDGLTFAFLCLDPSDAKRAIVEALERNGISFIDVGMGIVKTESALSGILRVSTSAPDNREEARSQMSFVNADDEDPYDTNIQVADLNCLNAALAVIKWKKIYGFYADLEGEHNTTYTIACNLLDGDFE
jgi:molybdopterin/thiamine biosynthesis adenylyltransferase